MQKPVFYRSPCRNLKYSCAKLVLDQKIFQYCYETYLQTTQNELPTVPLRFFHEHPNCLACTDTEPFSLSRYQSNSDSFTNASKRLCVSSTFSARYTVFFPPGMHSTFELTHSTTRQAQQLQLLPTRCTLSYKARLKLQ